MHELQSFISDEPIAAAMFDRDMRYVAYSPRWLADHRIDHIDLGASHYTVFPEIPQRWKDVHREALDGETLRAAADRFERANGEVVWLNWEVRPWRNRQGEIGGVVIFTEDVTERIETENALKIALTRLRLAPSAGAGGGRGAGDSPPPPAARAIGGAGRRLGLGYSRQPHFSQRRMVRAARVGEAG
jgi:hypothetical protein